MSNKAIGLPKPKKQRKKAQNSLPQRSLGKLGIGLISGTLTVIGAVVAMLTLLPRVSVTPSDPVDPNNSLSVSFTISNNNFIQLRHLSVGLAIGEIQPVGVPLDDPNVAYDRQGGILYQPWTDRTLDMDDHFTITPYDAIHALGDREGAISIVIGYQAWILPIRREKTFRFQTHRQTNGKLYWYALPSH